MDNGSGVLVLLEVVRALSNLQERPRRSLVFCFFMGEETGLLGSSHHIKNQSHTLDGILSYLNLDIVGAPHRLNAGGERARFPLLENLAEALHPLGVASEVTTSLHLHSDHVPFLLNGIPTLWWHYRFKEGTTQYCHSSADTLDKLDMGGLHLCAGASAALCFALAEEPERPSKRIPPKETRDMLIKANLEKGLRAEDSWPF
jgi:Zn-dependent M28 family amino/carboxypeptidase